MSSMLWASLIRANISSLVLFLELDSGVTGSLTVAASPGDECLQSSQTCLEETSTEEKAQVPSAGRGGTQGQQGLVSFLASLPFPW